jgi:ATP-dependent RNA helicase DDX46/PRP5
MYGENDVNKMSTLKGAAAEGDAAGTKLGPAAAAEKAKKDAKSAAESVRDVATDAVSAFMSGASGGAMAAQSAAAKAAARAAALSQKFGFRSTGKMAPPKPVEEVEVANKRFETTIEINDFPAEARFRVTRKEFVADISERSGTAITTRGTFFGPGAKVKEGDKKLYVGPLWRRPRPTEHPHVCSVGHTAICAL